MTAENTFTSAVARVLKETHGILGDCWEGLEDPLADRQAYIHRELAAAAKRPKLRIIDEELCEQRL